MRKPTRFKAPRAVNEHSFGLGVFPLGMKEERKVNETHGSIRMFVAEDFFADLQGFLCQEQRFSCFPLAVKQHCLCVETLGLCKLFLLLCGQRGTLQFGHAILSIPHLPMVCALETAAQGEQFFG